MRRIRETLRFQCQAVRLAVDHAAVASKRAGQFVPRVHLHARLIRMDLQHPPAHRIVDPHRGGRSGRDICCQNEAMIIAQAVEQLRIRLSDPCPEPRRLPEIKWSGIDGADLPGRNLRGVGRQEGLGRDGDLMAEHVAARGAAEVEIGMSAEVDDGRFGRSRLERERK